MTNHHGVPQPLHGSRPKIIHHMSSSYSTTTTSLWQASADDDDQKDDHRVSLGLVDVDCNLWHPDLQSFFLEGTPGTTTEEAPPAENNEPDPPRLLPNPWHMLQSDDLTHIAAMVTPSSTLTESRVAAATLDHYSNNPLLSSSSVLLRTTVGVHPYHVTDADVTTQTTTTTVEPSSSEEPTVPAVANPDAISAGMAELQRLYEQHSSWIAAVGECGLDRAPGFPPLDEHQVPWFRAQVNLAHQLQLPLFVHERWAFDETLEILQEAHEKHSPSKQQQQALQPPIPVLIHCFTGTVHELETYLQCGYYISLAGGFVAKGMAARATRHESETKDTTTTLDPTTHNAMEVVEALPRLWQETALSDRLLLETDAPYMGFGNGRRAYLQKHEAAIQTLLSSKKRKRLHSSTYPNVPSSLTQVLDLVHTCLVESSSSSTSVVVSRHELAHITTANAQRLFGFSLGSATP